jgi:DNA-binding transcriptional regulator LsrR (DeoR family)
LFPLTILQFAYFYHICIVLDKRTLDAIVISNGRDETLDEGRFDDLAIRVAWLYYQHGLTQEQIARKFRVSRTTVARVLQRARREGLVEFRFAPGPERLMLLEEKLCRQYALEEVILVPSTSSETALRTGVARATAGFLERSLEDGMVVGLGASRALHEMADLFAPSRKMPNCVFVQMLGGIASGDPRFDTYNVSWRLAETCGGSARHLFTPAVVDTPDAREVLVNDGYIAETLQLAAQCNLGIIAIGNSGPNCPILQMATCNSKTVTDVQTPGAVGEIIGRFYDIEGKAIRYDLDDRLVGLDLEGIRSLPFVVAVAGGIHRGPAILGALRQGFIKVLITDLNTGIYLADAFE